MGSETLGLTLEIKRRKAALTTDCTLVVYNHKQAEEAEVMGGCGRLKNSERELPSSSYNHAQYTDKPQNICEGVITNAIQSCSKELPCS